MHGSWRSWWILIPRGTHVIIIIIIIIFIIVVVIIIIIIAIVTMNINIKGALFLYLNPNPDYSIRNGYFVSLVKSKSRSWIQMIHKGGGFFRSLSKTGYFGHILSVSLLRIRKEWTLPAVTRNNFNTYNSFLTRRLTYTVIFEPESWIKRWILSVL